MRKASIFYIIIFGCIVGFLPARVSAAYDIAYAGMQTATAVHKSDSRIKSDFCRPAPSQLTQSRKEEWQNWPGGGVGATWNFTYNGVQFISSRHYIIGYTPIQAHLIHNYPSHSFW